MPTAIMFIQVAYDYECYDATDQEILEVAYENVEATLEALGYRVSLGFSVKEDE